MKLAGLAACFAAGALVAGVLVAGGVAADTTTTETATETTTVAETTTEPTTVLATTTVEQTTTQRVILPATTGAGESSSSGTPVWVWVLLGILAVALAVAIFFLARRGGGTVPADERRRRLDMAVASWMGQGWAVESQTGESAVLQRAGERMMVSVDSAGQVGVRPLSGGPA